MFSQLFSNFLTVFDKLVVTAQCDFLKEPLFYKWRDIFKKKKETADTDDHR